MSLRYAGEDAKDTGATMLDRAIAMLALFALGRPLQTFFGAAVVSLGLPISWLVVSSRSRSVA